MAALAQEPARDRPVGQQACLARVADPEIQVPGRV